MSDFYSPPSRNHPQKLPDFWKFEDGTVHTDLQTLSDDELHALGWHGPIEMPSTEIYFTHRIEWNSDTLSFDCTELEDYEKDEGVNYKRFWKDLLEGTAYQKIKNSAKVSLEANVAATEFIALLSDAKSGDANVEKIQGSLLEILSAISFTAEELAEIQQAFTESGMFAVYTLS